MIPGDQMPVWNGRFNDFSDNGINILYGNPCSWAQPSDVTEGDAMA
jgi:hypothetical protein